ncbi:MAG: Bax inhibitor-1/YccA family protein [Patiriisocius sp.]|uniref:Bax inhibitor-1/YccA family protein n=1 Tax=Patiriisocius sp. TaxID=2822396 RepID=UPI003EF71B72
MEEIQQPQSQLFIQDLTSEKRVAFYRKTYTHLALAVLLFVLVEMVFFQIEPLVNFALSLTQGWTWLLMLGGFMLVTSYAEKMAIENHDTTKQYLALLIYVIAEAFIFIPLIFMAMYTAGDGGSHILSQAAIMTLSLFTGLSAIVLLTKKDFSFLKSILAIGFFIALGLIIAGTLFGFNLGLWFSVGMIALASGSILYQTSNMVHKYSEDQYVGAALGLFASLMLLFWYILSILNRN